jgi:tRNA (guanosine-2'-O-)-methyltransferase
MTRNLSSTELKRLHRTWRAPTTHRLALLLDGVQTPFNVGAILRTAAAYRVDHLWLVDPTASPTDAKTQKTALGSQKYLTWTILPSVTEAAAQIRDAGYALIGVELADGAEPLFALDLARDVCLAVGHEDRGLSSTCLDACDAIGFLPLLGKIGSLNVATAASMAMYEARRQDWQRPAAAAEATEQP